MQYADKCLSTSTVICRLIFGKRMIREMLIMLSMDTMEIIL